MNQLNAFSMKFADQLFRAYPDWRRFARIKSGAVGDGGVLVVEVPPPPEAKVNYGLVITTDNDEVTVGFDHYHSHFDWPVRFDEPTEPTINPMAFIAAILAEQIAVASWWEGETWVGSAMLSSGEEPEKFAPPRAITVRVRSWKGTLNRDSDAQ